MRTDQLTEGFLREAVETHPIGDALTLFLSLIMWNTALGVIYRININCDQVFLGKAAYLSL